MPECEPGPATELTPILPPLRERIERDGPIGFAEYMQIVLYGEGGYYRSAELRASKRGDFVTSPEIGAVFGECLASIIRPGERVVDAGGGAGTLARALADSSDGEVVVVESSASARHRCQVDGIAAYETLADLPWSPDLVIANELLDNLVADLRSVDGTEFRVGLARSAVRLEGTSKGCVPEPIGVLRWIDELTSVAHRGTRAILFDYGAPISELASRQELPVRAYRGHRRVNLADAAGGDCDVTVDVPIERVVGALTANGWDTETSSQGDWLNMHGLAETRLAAQAAAARAAQAGDYMAQLVAKSRLTECGALADNAGLGNFIVFGATLGSSI